METLILIFSDFAQFGILIRLRICSRVCKTYVCVAIRTSTELSSWRYLKKNIIQVTFWCHQTWLAGKSLNWIEVLWKELVIKHGNWKITYEWRFYMVFMKGISLKTCSFSSQPCLISRGSWTQNPPVAKPRPTLQGDARRSSLFMTYLKVPCKQYQTNMCIPLYTVLLLLMQHLSAIYLYG